MKVLILGAPRTGTTSTGKALSILGYSVYSHLGSKNVMPDFTKAMQAKYQGKGRPYTKEEYDRIVGYYDAGHGIGFVALADDLLAAFPDAKVILTPRDPDEWVESWNSSVPIFHRRWAKWYRRWIWLVAGGRDRDFQLFREVAFPACGYEDPSDRAAQRRSYVGYNQHIRDVVPKKRLLEFRPEQGWTPLCEFLDVPMPRDTPFPRAAARADLMKGMTAMWERALRRALFHIAGASGIATVVFVLLLRYVPG